MKGLLAAAASFAMTVGLVVSVSAHHSAAGVDQTKTDHAGRLIAEPAYDVVVFENRFPSFSPRAQAQPADVVDGDPRVPRPQSEELHMALKQPGIPTEFFVYPGNTHGIPDPRNQYLKAVAEFTWFEKWIRGKPWFTWKELLKSVEDSVGVASKVAGN